MKTIYIIRRITRRYAGRTCTTIEKAVARLDSIAALLQWAADHNATAADLEELTDDIETMGVGGWKGYEVAEYTVR